MNSITSHKNRPSRAPRRMFTGLALLALGLVFVSMESLAATPQEQMSITTEIAKKGTRRDGATHTWPSSVATHSGFIYYAYVDNNEKVAIAKKREGAGYPVVVGTIPGVAPLDGNGHMAPSIGVSSDGYIHVTFGMHDDPWRYWVSNNPENVSGFTNYSGNSSRHPPQQPGAHEVISYPAFVRDNDKNLYVTYRCEVVPQGEHGNIGAIAKYNPATKGWVGVGGTNYKNGNYIKAFCWSDNDGRGGAQGDPRQGYQIFMPRIHFDSTNRWHVSWGVYVRATTTNEDGRWSHIMYAYSDDNGQTFKKANGIADPNGLPLEQTGVAEEDGDIVADSSGDFYKPSTRTGSYGGKPFIVYAKEGAAIVSRWTGSAWEESAPGTTGQFLTEPRGLFVVDRNDIITSILDTSIYRSWDGGQTWKEYPVPNNVTINTNTNFDFAYLQETGGIRFASVSGSQNGASNVDRDVTVYTAVFTGGSPPSPPAAPSNLTATAVLQTQINLAWADNSNNETGFKIERKTGAGSFSQIATPGADATTFNNTGLSAGTAYTYRVRATNPNGDSAYSNEASATTSAAAGATVRIETGGSAPFTDSLGNVWAADQYFTGGTTLDRGNIAIVNTVEDRIYQTERYGMTAYTIPVPNGTYTVKLHLAETAAIITGPGQRVFTVKAEGVAPAGWANIDVYVQAGGKNKALVKTATVTVNDGALSLGFTSTANQPEVNGIEVISQ